MFAGEPICPIFDLTILSDATAVQLLLKFLLPSALDSFAPIRYLFKTYSWSSTLISLTSYSGRDLGVMEKWCHAFPFLVGSHAVVQHVDHSISKRVWTRTVLTKKSTIFASVALQGYTVMCENAQKFILEMFTSVKIFLLCCNYWTGVFYQTKQRKHDVVLMYIVNGRPCSLNISTGPW